MNWLRVIIFGAIAQVSHQELYEIAIWAHSNDWLGIELTLWLRSQEIWANAHGTRESL